MKYLHLSLQQRQSLRHPMHQFVVEHDGFEASRQLGSTITDGLHAALFHVDGWPPEPYEEALAELDSIREYALSTQSDETFSVYVQEEVSEYDLALIDGLGQPGLVSLFPIRYLADGSMRIRLVGPSATLQEAIDSIPGEISVDVHDIGSYDARRIGGVRDITDRQAAAVTAAVDCGYYEDPREGSVADVGNRIGCSPSTAAEHLRRAERTIMSGYVGS